MRVDDILAHGIVSREYIDSQIDQALNGIYAKELKFSLYYTITRDNDNSYRDKSPIEVCEITREFLATQINHLIGREDVNIAVGYNGWDRCINVMIELYDLCKKEFDIISDAIRFDTININYYGYLMLSDYEKKVKLERK
jgi:hypothetical protein